MKVHRILGRIFLLLWVAACLAVLVFSFAQRDVHDMPVAAFWLMVFLSFPSGLFAVGFSGYATSETTRVLGIPYEPFAGFVPMWLAGVAVGYWQWFVAVPWIVRKVAVHLSLRSSGGPSTADGLDVD